jgi:hypothetical protein
MSELRVAHDDIFRPLAPPCYGIGASLLQHPPPEPVVESSVQFRAASASSPPLSLPIIEENLISHPPSVSLSIELPGPTLCFAIKRSTEDLPHFSELARPICHSLVLAELEECILPRATMPERLEFALNVGLPLPISSSVLTEDHRRPPRIVLNVRSTPAEKDGDLTMLLPDPPRDRSRIFLRATPAVIRPDTADLRPAILVDESMLSIPEFQAQFSDCWIIVRKLRAASIEISDRCAVLLGALLYRRNGQIAHL